MKMVACLFRVGPLLFGIGFLAPVIAASLQAFRVQPPFGFSPVAVGLIIGMALGSLAMWRRTWL